MRKFIASTALAASVAGGGLVGAVVFTPAVSGAQTDDPSVTEPETDEDTETGCERGPRGMRLDEIATILGTDADTLRDQLADGQSLADIAGDQTDEVIDHLVGEVEEKLDGAVEDERLTEEEADEKLAEATERITDAVNGEGEFPGRFGHRGPRGFGGPRGDMPADDGDASDAAATDAVLS